MSSSSGDLVATGVPRQSLHDHWVGLWPLIKPAYDQSPEKDDILAGLMSKDFQLWAVYARNVPVAGIVTRILRVGTSSRLDCRLWLIGGERLSDWAPDLLNILIPWAKAEGCTTLSGSGRRGWARIVRRFGGVRIADENGQPAWELAI